MQLCFSSVELFLGVVVLKSVGSGNILILCQSFFHAIAAVRTFNAPLFANSTCCFLFSTYRLKLKRSGLGLMEKTQIRLATA